jgi:hypothetical protein
MAEEKKEFLTYKGRPLVRSKNILYYGDMRDSHVVMLQIMETKQSGDEEIAGRIVMQLMSTNPKADPSEMVLKRSERVGLFNSLDLAAAWLDRQLGPAEEE